MMYAKFSTCDADGQFTDGFAIKVQAFNIHLMTNDGLLVDFWHEDDTVERVLIGMKPYRRDLKIGHCAERIVDFRIVPFASPLLTKDEYHERVGKGKFMHPTRRHFVDSSEL